MQKQQRVLFLCVANSCRSQMAEGLIRHYLGDFFETASAGTMATFVQPHAIRVMAELGIDISGQSSKQVDTLYGQAFDHVITVCDDGGDSCPVWLGPGKRKHIPFRDPVRAVGTEEEVLSEFRAVRDEMKQTLVNYLQNERQ